MNAWSLIPGGFGLWWLASGLAALQLLSVWSWIGLVTGAVVVAASGLGRQSLQMVDRRTFRFSVLAEGAGIAVILLACDVSRRPDLIMPLVGTVVGLHFLPLASAFGNRRFLLSGSLMTVVCLCSLTWPLPVRTAIAGIGAGGILWAFALWSSLARVRAGSASVFRRREFFFF